MEAFYFWMVGFSKISILTIFKLRTYKQFYEKTFLYTKKKKKQPKMKNMEIIIYRFFFYFILE